MQFRCSLILCSLVAITPLAATAQTEPFTLSAARDAADSYSIDAGTNSLPDAPVPQQGAQSPAPSNDKQNSESAPADKGALPSKQQPKRILGLMPNYRTVSEGAIPPPPTPRQAFKIATENTFD
jgi:hypothetical protein